jgi:hypothetical protein
MDETAVDVDRNVDFVRDAISDRLPENKYWLLVPSSVLLVFVLWLLNTIASGEVQHVWQNSIGAWLDQHAAQLLADQVKSPLWVFPGVLLVGAISAYSVRARVLVPADSTIETMAEVTRNLEIITHGLIEQAKPGLSEAETLADTLEAVLRRLASAYKGDVTRAHILVPSVTEPDWLVWYTGYGYPRDVSEYRYFIGKSGSNPDSRRGVAGEAYRSRSPIVCRVNRRTYQSSSRAYIPPDRLEPKAVGVRPHDWLVYSSFIAVPISKELVQGRDDSQEDESANEQDNESRRVLGVLCLDSKNRGTFAADPLGKRSTIARSPQAPFLRIIYRLLSEGEAMKK